MNSLEVWEYQVVKFRSLQGISLRSVTPKPKPYGPKTLLFRLQASQVLEATSETCGLQTHVSYSLNSLKGVV